MDRHLTYCRICAAACGLVVATKDRQVMEVRGDPDHPVSRGYTCAKGRASGDWHHRSDRLDTPRIDGREASWNEVLDDLARRLDQAARSSAPDGSSERDAIAMYLATGFAYDSAAQVAASGFMRTIGSSSFATAATVDNAPVLVAAELVAGQPMLNPVWDPDSSGLLIFVGSNPVVSHGYGTALPDPVRYLRDYQRRGGTVIVIDPRRTETAALADVHIANAPGSDVAVLAWLASEVLATRGRSDDPSDLDPTDLATLRDALQPFTLERATASADVDKDVLSDLRDRTVAADGQLAMFCGTGVTMARDGVLAEWMRWLLLALTDSLDRPGGMRFHRGVVNRLRRPKPNVPPLPGPRSRPDLRRVAGQLPAVALVDEIEAGNIRALILAGGNPLASLPQPNRVRRALASLEVLATIDVVESDITQLATHVLPATGQLERSDITLTDGVGLRSGIQATDPVLPAAAERRPAWWILTKLARAMGSDMLGGTEPDGLDDRGFLGTILQRSPLGADAIFAAGPRGLQTAGDTRWVLDELVPGGRWQLAPPELVERLVAHETSGVELILIPHRQAKRSNSIGFGEPDAAIAEAFLNPEDAHRTGLADGDAVTVRSEHGEVASVARLSDTVRRGVVACSHGRGLEGTGNLVSLADIDSLTAMPVASGVPVTLTRRVAAAATTGEIED